MNVTKKINWIKALYIILGVIIFLIVFCIFAYFFTQRYPIFTIGIP